MDGILFLIESECLDNVSTWDMVALVVIFLLRYENDFGDLIEFELHECA